MDQIYMDRRPDSRRIHIEIDENDVSELLDDLKDSPDLQDAFAATRRFLEILESAKEQFKQQRREDAYEAEISRT